MSSYAWGAAAVVALVLLRLVLVICRTRRIARLSRSTSERRAEDHGTPSAQ